METGSGGSHARRSHRRARERSGSRVDFLQKPATSLSATLLLTARNSAIAGFRSLAPMLWRIVRLAFKAAVKLRDGRVPTLRTTCRRIASIFSSTLSPPSFDCGDRDAGARPTSDLPKELQEL